LAHLAIKVSRITAYRKTISGSALRKALDEVGGEPLAGSGFESEMPDPEFTSSEYAPPPEG
jgi:hypothetical protein